MTDKQFVVQYFPRAFSNTFPMDSGGKAVVVYTGGECFSSKLAGGSTIEEAWANAKTEVLERDLEVAS